MKINVNVDIEKPIEIVWHTITDIENSIDIITGIVDLKVLNKPDQGLVGLKWQETREVFGKQAKETMWITAAKEQKYYDVRAENHGMIYLSTLSVTEMGGKTQLSMSFNSVAQSFFVKILSAFMGLFVKKTMMKMLQKDLNDIKAYLEKNL